MIDVNSHGKRLESTRAAQAVVREKALRVLERKRPSMRGHRAPMVRRGKAEDRLVALVEMHPGLRRVPGPVGLTPDERKRGEAERKPELRGSTAAYRAYHAGLLTSRQARLLGCVLDNSGTGRKPGASQLQSEPKPIAFDTAGGMPWTPKLSAEERLKRNKARNRRRYAESKRVSPRRRRGWRKRIKPGAVDG